MELEEPERLPTQESQAAQAQSQPQRKRRCVHGIQSKICRTCCPSAFCVHNRRRYRCKDCATGLCSHGRYKHACADCGTGVCRHGILQNSCRDCSERFCIHRIRKLRCKDCSPFASRIKSKSWCIVCLDTKLSSKRVRAGLRSCAKCEPDAKPLRTELIVRPLLLERVPFPPSCEDDTLLGGKGCDGAAVRRPDLAWFMAGTGGPLRDFVGEGSLSSSSPPRAAFVEIDEDGGHPDRLPECEAGKMWDQTAAAKQLLGEDTLVFFFRFNPDRWDGEGDHSLEARAATVAADINNFLRGDFDATIQQHIPNVRYYFYHSSCHFHIEHTKSKAESFCVHADTA